MGSVLVNEFIGDAKMNRYFWGIFIVCLLTTVFDGYDAQVFGAVLPSVMSDWHLTPGQAGMLASWGVVGMLIGSLFYGPLADKIGKSKALMIATLGYSVFTVSVGFSRGFSQFAAFRLLAGISLAGAYPIAVALATEYSPKNIRSRLVVWVAAGMPIGTILSLLVGLGVLTRYGWRPMFYVAAIPVLVMLGQAKLPESMSLYIKKGQKEKIARVLEKVSPGYVPSRGDEYRLGAFHEGKGTVGSLFRQGIARNTILFWCMMFVNYNFGYGVGLWLTKLLTMQGFSLTHSLLFTLCWHSGFALGIPVYGWSQDRFGGKRTLQVNMALLALFATSIGLVREPALLAVLLFFGGANQHGVSCVAGSYMSQCYPLSIRATGTAWGYGLGRLGGTVGPLVTGLLLTLHVPIYMAFATISSFQIISIILVSFTTDYSRVTATPQLAEAMA